MRLAVFESMEYPGKFTKPDAVMEFTVPEAQVGYTAAD
jgi:hypothetical protein